MEYNEDQILREIDKNPEAFGQIIEHYHKSLDRFVARISYFTNEDREDILQNAYIKAYKNIHRYDNSMKFSTWLYHIVRNVTIDEIRKKAVRPQLYSLESEDIPKICITEESGFEELIRKQDQERVRQAINQLPETYREVIFLRFVEEKSYEEIMDIVELPKGTVAAKISRAKKILEKLLEENVRV